MKLTAQNVQNLKLKAGETDVIHWDDELPGFGVRLRESGSRNFIYQYRVGTKQRRITLGAVAIGLVKARETAKDLHAKIRLGADPAAETIQARHDATQTFGDISKLYLADKASSMRVRSFGNIERHLTDHAKPLHRLQLTKVTRGDIKTLLGGVAKTRGEVTANRVQTSISTFFAWCVEHGRTDANPCMGITKYKEQSRDRVLESWELRAIWNSLGDDHFGSIVKLLALTGQRQGEIAGLRWDEIRGDTIELPAERVKNNRHHTVPLSGPARAIIHAQHHIVGRDLIFGIGQGPFNGWSNSMDRLNDRIEEQLGKRLEHWTPHDLRRTAATMMADIGVQPWHIEAVLNHASGHKAGVAGIYNRSSYAREKRQALELWADKLMAIVEGRDSNVIPMRQSL
jgi:integrase